MFPSLKITSKGHALLGKLNTRRGFVKVESMESLHFHHENGSQVKLTGKVVVDPNYY